MNFPCPKCDAKTPLDLSHIPEEGTSVKCQECKNRFWITRESFARRALGKEGKTLCYHCNHELSTYLNCPTCGVMYPDFCVIQTSKPVRKKQRKTSTQISFSIRPQRRPQVGTLQQPTQRASRSLLAPAIILVLVAVLVVAVSTFYLNNRAEEQYSAGFFRALYGIKLGTDLSLRQCATIAAAAKAKMGAGQNVALTISEAEKIKLISAKSDIDTLMKRLPKTPQKFSKANDNLAKLYDVYSKSNSLAASPSGSLPAFTDSADRLERDFKQTAQELKSTLPPELAEKYQKASSKYKELQTL